MEYIYQFKFPSSEHKLSHFPISVPIFGVTSLFLPNWGGKQWYVGAGSWEDIGHVSAQLLVQWPHTASLKLAGGRAFALWKLASTINQDSLLPKLVFKCIPAHQWLWVVSHSISSPSSPVNLSVLLDILAFSAVNCLFLLFSHVYMEFFDFFCWFAKIPYIFFFRCYSLDAFGYTIS